MSMSKSEAARMAALEARVEELERALNDDSCEGHLGADHAEHVAASPRKRRQKAAIA